MNTERKPPRKIDLEIREFNEATATIVCNLDDQLVKYIGKNLDTLDTAQIKDLLAFVRALRRLKVLLLKCEKGGFEYGTL